MKKLSFYTVAERLAELQMSVNNVYEYVDEIILRVGPEETEESISKFLKQHDKEDKVKIFKKKFTNFADIRNFALFKTTGDWVLTLDSDETFSEKSLKSLRKLIQQDKYDGYKFFRIHFYKTAKQAMDPFKHKYLFRRKAGVKYAGNVHELLTGIEKIMEITDRKMVIYHYNSYSYMIKNNKKYHSILLGELAAAKKAESTHLIDLANFRLWANANIDNPENFRDEKKMKELQSEFDKRLKAVLGNNTHYHAELAQLEKLAKS